MPRYCSASHRQRAYEARRTTAAASSMALPGLQRFAEEYQRLASSMAVPALQRSAEQYQQMASSMALPALQHIAEQYRHLASSMDVALRRSVELWRDVRPPNWPDDAALSDVVELVRETGWSLTYVPRSEVITQLLQAQPDDRPKVLIAHAEDVVADCRECLAQLTDKETTYLVDALCQALDAFEAGLMVPAQAAVVSVLGDVINRASGLTFSAAARRWAQDPEDVPMPQLRFWLITCTVPRALDNFNCHNGDPVPDRFNRHASVHTVDPRQFTRLNALVALLLAVGLVREFATDWPASDDSSNGG